MSGRKASEVASVLEKAEKNRAATELNYRNVINNRLNSMNNNNNKVVEYNIKFASYDFSIDDRTKSELPEESKNLETEVINLLNQARKGSNYNNTIKNIENKRDVYDKTLRDLDADAKKVRDDVKKKSNGWYCDDEYERAKVINNKMKELGSNKNAFLREVEVADKQIYDEEIRLKNIREQLEKCEKRATEINKRATEMIHLRQEAGKAKDCIKSIIDNIDLSIANKFMQAEYGMLCKEVGLYYSKSDNEIIDGLSNMMNKISKFSMKLDGIYQEWKAKKEKTVKYKEKIELLTTEGMYYNPAQYISNPETAVAMNIFEFLALYYNNDYENMYTETMKKAVQKLDEEKFDECCEILSTIEELLIQASAFSGTLQNQLMGSFQLAVDTRNIMYNVGFDVETAFVNGKNACDGFCIKCSMGDEIIDFDKIMVNSDGSVVMNINHTEGASSCGTSWKVLQDKFNDAGIPMTDVKKNGKSIFTKKASTSTSSENVSSH